MERVNDFSPYEMGMDPNLNDMYKDPMFNPIVQYEQAFMYYKYQTQQLEYKIKCKEYERLCKDEHKKREIN